MNQDINVQTPALYCVEEQYAGIRIDKILQAIYPDKTRSYFQKLIEAQQVTLNNKACKVSTKPNLVDTIAVYFPQPVPLNIQPENIPLDILYEDEDIIIVNKPKGMVVHPACGHMDGTLVNALLYHCQNQLSGINGILRPGIVHRIDKDTTGSIIACKTDFAHQAIANQLKEHSITRKYQAIVHGMIKEDGTVSAPIGRHPMERKKMAVNEKNGKPATTHYHVLQHFHKYTYIQCQLETGRTHQIRVHMASISHPLLGDSLYGPSKTPFSLEGQCLHAKTIGIIHPRTNQYLEVEAPLPEYFTNLLKKLST